MSGFNNRITVEELAVETEKFIKCLNDNYLHSALEYKTPDAFKNFFQRFNNYTLARQA